MTKQTFKLLSGAEIPVVGLGTWQLEGQQGHDAVVYALQNGYRMIDAAYSYFNQENVGKAVKDSGIPRSEIFIVDKLANTWHTAADECLSATLKNLDVEYLDLWLMHWPSPLNHKGNDKKTPKLPDGSIDFEQNWTYVDTWKSMIDIQMKNPDVVKHIGVANCGVEELEKLIKETGVTPEVNQVELHPSNNQQDLHKYCKEKGIQLVAYSPLGSIGSPLLENKDLQKIASDRTISIAQLLLSWGVANGWPVIPRSQNPERILANIKLVDLSNEEVETISSIGNDNKQRFVTAPWHTFSD